MKLVDPSVEIITETDPLKRIELCGRVCYKSEDKITETSAGKFVSRMIRSGHTSVLEHARIKIYTNAQHDEYLQIMENSFIPKYRRVSVYWKVDSPFPDYVTVNARDYINSVHGATADDIAAHVIDDGYLTVRFICDRAIANELVRHRVFSFSQESTRYVSYREGVTFVRPVPFPWADYRNDEEYNHYTLWYNAMASAEIAYRSLCSTGLMPQEARTVLPLSTKTELVMSGLIPQWQELLNLRLAPSAHPQMIYLMKMLVDKVPKLIAPPF